jgi:anti-sigma factor ChrR (cupin superfamily)
MTPKREQNSRDPERARGPRGPTARRRAASESAKDAAALYVLGTLPPHIHRGIEECYVLEGDLEMGGHKLHAGDYQFAFEDSLHGVQSSEDGCLLLIVSSQDDELV